MRATSATGTGTLFSEILIATDLSDTSDNALGYAKAMARAFDSELLLVHVTDPIAHVTVPEGAWADDSARIEWEMEATRNAGTALRAEGLKAKDLCLFGAVASEVAEAAKQQHADLIVTGTHSRKGVNRLLFGSEAESILKASPLPVLIVGPKASLAPAGKFAFRLLVCAVHLDEHGADVALFARDFANERAAKFQLVALPFYDALQEAGGYWAFKDRLHDRVPEESAAKLSPVVLSEPPDENLVELAIARNADLIIFDQRRGLITPHLHGGILADIVATAPCPVLAIPSLNSAAA